MPRKVKIIKYEYNRVDA